jgi:nicotinate-nucleotide--dimethylbenzimidazole phosphoribosyltransferase
MTQDPKQHRLTRFGALLGALPRPRTPTARAAPRDRNGQLTKPPGALGRLEELALWYAGWRGRGRVRR